MQTRMIKPELIKDDWFSSLTPDEKWFFTYFLVSDDIQFSGIGNIPERQLAFETGYEISTVQHLKSRMQKAGKLLFFKEWVCIVNFWTHNPMLQKSENIQIAAGDHIARLPGKVYDFFNQKLKELEAPMSMEDYLEKRRRNQVKKMVRKEKKWLQGAQLEEEVDRRLGIADSGKMDWATVVESGKPASQYQTPESVFPKIKEVAQQYALKQWALYWHFKKKVLKYQGSGRTKSDYLAVLEECATKAKPMKRAEKIQAMMLFSKEVVKENPPMTAEMADSWLTARGDI
jgi:hypothetical protein